MIKLAEVSLALLKSALTPASVYLALIDQRLWLSRTAADADVRTMLPDNVQSGLANGSKDAVSQTQLTRGWKASRVVNVLC